MSGNHHQRRESPTAFLTKHHPVIKAVLDYSFGLLSKEIRFIIVMMTVGSLFTFTNCRHNKLAEKVAGNASDITNIVNAISP